MRFSLVACFFTATCMGASAIAGASADAVPVQSILSDPRQDQKVVVRGHLTSRIGEHDYVLGDDTGRIRIGLDDRLVGQHLLLGAPVEVHGRVDKKQFKPPSIRANQIMVLAASRSRDIAAR
jgi:uncharacterized protein YdeI (BOF family)